MFFLWYNTLILLSSGEAADERTGLKKMHIIKRIAIFMALLPMILLISYIPARAEGPPGDIVARGAILAEVDTGKILLGYNPDRAYPADALTKVMTLLIAVSSCADGIVDVGDLVKMTESAWSDLNSKSTTRNIRPGEEMTLLDLMYCAYTGSANEAANMIAEYIAGSVEDFVGIMNKRAKDIGCEKTNFVNPHGQYDDNQVTTAHDQFLIYREGLEYPLFQEISGTIQHTVESSSNPDQRRLTSSNSLLNSGNKYYYRHCASGLASAVFGGDVTGASYEGGYSIVALAETDVLSLIVVILGSDDIILEDGSAELRNLTEARRIFEWGFSQFSWRTILSTTAPVARAPITHGAGADYVNLNAETEIRELLDNDIPDKDIEKNVKIYSVENGEDLYAPITAGEVLGEVTITLYGEDLGTVLLLANTNVDLHRFQYIKIKVSEVLSGTVARVVIWTLVLLVLAYAALVVRYNILRMKRIRMNNEVKQRIREERQNPNKIDEGRDTRSR